jgi:hypothetical protein
MALNKVKWQQFVKQAKGLNITDVHIKREDRGGNALLKYNARARNGRIITGEWAIEAKGKEASAVDGEIRTFLELARKDFFVKREGDLAGEGWKSAQDDEAAKTKPLAAGEGSAT